MALHGTIKDFGLSEIFQLIGIQRKTGVLTLENDEDTVTVHFHEGQVVGANTRLRNLEDLLGGVLVRTGRIAEQELQNALRIQKKTLKRLGYVLVESGAISEHELREALQVQVTQIVYRLFRWREGAYRFAATEHIDYDREHFVPVSAETILMEGARMVDEWPIIERKIRSAQLVFQKTPAGAALEAPVRSLVDTDIPLGAGEADEGPAPEVRVSTDEREILRAVDGQNTVQDIVDASPLGEFDVYRVLYELLNRHLIEEVQRPVAAVAARSGATIGRFSGGMLLALVLLGSALGLLGLTRQGPTPWKLALDGESSRQLGSYVSRARLERIEEAIELFYLDLAALPEGLDQLALNGYLAPGDLVDPWGQPYRYDLLVDGYVVSGAGPDGESDDLLSLEHRFSTHELLVLDGVPADSQIAP